MKPKTTVFSIILTSLLVATAPAATTVVGMYFNINPTGASTQSNFTANPVDLVAGDGITVSTTTQGTGGNPVGFAWDNGSNGDTAFEGSVVGRLQSDTTPSFFTISVADNVTWTLDTISFAYRGATGSDTNRQLTITASVGGGSPVAVYTSASGLVGRNSTPNWAGARNPTISLGSAFQGLSDTTVQFNFSTSGGGLDIDAIEITAIPEPSAALLGGLGLLALLRRRR